MIGGDTAGVLVLPAALAWLVIGVFALLFAARRRRRGSPTWAWVLPGAAGIVFVLLGLLLLWWRAA